MTNNSKVQLLFASIFDVTPRSNHTTF